MISTCAVCNASVDISRPKEELWIDPKAIAEGVQRKSLIVICARKRCKRLLREAMAEEGRREVKR